MCVCVPVKGCEVIVDPLQCLLRSAPLMPWPTQITPQIFALAFPTLFQFAN